MSVYTYISQNFSSLLQEAILVTAKWMCVSLILHLNVCRYNKTVTSQGVTVTASTSSVWENAYTYSHIHQLQHKSSCHINHYNKSEEKYSERSAVRLPLNINATVIEQRNLNKILVSHDHREMLIILQWDINGGLNNSFIRWIEQ